MAKTLDETVTAVAPEPPAPEAERRRGVWRQNVSLFASNRFAVAALIFLLAIILFCFVGPLIYRTNQTGTTLLTENLPPSWQYPLGTDPQGFSVLGRLMVGGQSTIEVGLLVAVISTAFGAAWGALAGYIGGTVDSILMRAVDMMLSIPFLLFLVLLATLLTPTLPLIAAAIAAVSWPSTARIVRGETLSLRARDYVVAARSFGSRHFPLVRRHIMPNSMGSILVNGTLTAATAILLFASLSFLGLGQPTPATNWGKMITVGMDYFGNGYWWDLWPAAVAIVLTVIAVNAVGDGLYDVVTRRQSDASQ